MRPFAPIVVLAALTLTLHVALADDVYKWVDEQGRVHYSNRGGDSAAEAPPEKPGEGWESVLERQEGADEFGRRAEVVINSLTADRIRKKRERDRAREALAVTQAEIVRAQTQDPSRVPNLRAREVPQVADLNKLENELVQIDANIARVKAIKTMGKEQAEKLGENPLLQFGQ